MEFRILGPLEVVSDGLAIDLGRPKQRALLALLLLDANRVLARDRLIEALWDAEPPETAASSLHGYVSQLRKLLGKQRLLTVAPGYMLRVAPDELDLQRFLDLRAGGRLDEALSLWRGSPLADFADQRFAQGEIARLEELHLACLEERVERDLARGRHAALVAELDSLVREHPHREALVGQLMLSLYRAGRQADALDAYQTARHALVEELGIEPGRALRDLHQSILQQDPDLDFAAPAAPTVEARRGGFVGRTPERAELVGALDDAEAGHGRLVLLSGEPGIGKSRLAEEAITLAVARGAAVLVGRCWEAGDAPAFWPWAQALRGYVREAETALLGEHLAGVAAGVVQIVPELRERLPALPEPPPLDSEGARFRLFDATAEFLRNAAEQRPALLVLDDLHAADEPSLLLLRFLARELGSMRLLLVGAYRDVDPLPGPQLTEMIAAVSREPVTRRLALTGLSKQEIADYVEETAADIADPQLVETLHDETDGNPLFVGEIVRLIAEEGITSGARAETGVAIPQSVRDVIARRLAHLSDECNRVLVLASVLGREFPVAALALMAGVSEDELLVTLDEAMVARIVSDVPGSLDRLRFAHVLIRDTRYEGLSTARRVGLHRQAVAALEALYGDEPGSNLAELASQAIAGNDPAKGLSYARRAGDHAVTLLAYEEAARLYGVALDVLDAAHEDERTRCELLLALGEAEARAGNPAAKKTFLQAAELAQRLELPHDVGRAAAGYGGRLAWARGAHDERLVPLLEAGLAAEYGDVELRARLLARLAGALRDEHSRDRRDTLSREAVELARRTGDPAALVYALDGRIGAIIGPDTLAECVTLAGELREVATQIGDRERLVQAHDTRVVAYAMTGNIAEADADQRAASRIAAELRQPAQLWQAAGTEAALALAAGRLDEAEELVERAFAFGERAQPEMAIPVYRLQRYTFSDLRGRLAEVEPEIRTLVAEYPSRPVFRCVLAHVHARIGRPGEAKRALRELAEDDYSALPFDQEWLFGMSLLAETAALVEDTGFASVLYGLLLPWSALSAADPAEGIRGSVARYLGQLAGAMEQWEQAADHFEDAVAMNERMGARPWLARTRHDYAALLLTRNGPGDCERARGLLDAALAAYRELGMESDEARAASLLADSGRV